MTRAEVRAQVVSVIQRILTDSGRTPGDLADDDRLTGAVGLDSLDLAVMVVGLEQSLGIDPFREGAAPVATIGALVDLYAERLESSDASSEGDSA